MIFSLRHLLVFFLVLLQFIAPLVHAHTSEKILSRGLHIPGLESYGQAEPDDKLSSLPCQALVLCGDIDGQIVGVNTGLNRHKNSALCKIFADSDNYYLPTSTYHLKTVVFLPITTPRTNFVSQASHIIQSAHCPRAPPLYA